METVYAEEKTKGSIRVEFMNKDGIRLARGFDSDFLAQKFIRKLKYTNCSVIAYVKQ